MEDGKWFCFSDVVTSNIRVQYLQNMDAYLQQEEPWCTGMNSLYSCINAHLAIVHVLHNLPCKQTHCKSDLITLIMHFWSICQQTMSVL